MKNILKLVLRIFYAVTIVAYSVPVVYFAFLTVPRSSFKIFAYEFHRAPDLSFLILFFSSLILIPCGRRISSIISNPAALDIHTPLKTPRAFRSLAIIMMGIGLACMVPFFNPNTNGGFNIGLIVLYVLIQKMVVLGLLGIIIFEIVLGSYGKEKGSTDALPPQTPPFHSTEEEEEKHAPGNEYERIDNSSNQKFSSPMFASVIVACTVFVALYFFIHELDGRNNKDNILFKAVSNNDYELVRTLVKRGADVTCHNCGPNKTEGSILSEAVSEGNPKVVALLIEKGATVNEHRCLTLLHIAANTSYYKSGHPEIAKLLIKHGADVNEKNCKGETPLHYSAMSGEASRPEYRSLTENRLETAKVLIASGANVNMQADNGDTPLHKAAQNKNLSMIKLLLTHGAKINVRNKQGVTPLGLAALASDYGETAQWLAGQGAVLDPGEIEQLSKDAALHGKIRFLKVLIANGAKFTPDKTDEENRDEKIALQEAIKCMDAEHSICFETVKLLLEQGADPNEKDTYGETALHIAARRGAEDIAKILLTHGAEINSRAKDLHTPLHNAVKTNNPGSYALTKLLLDNGADINATYGYGQDETPLSLAITKGDVEVVKLLLSRGAHVDAACKNDLKKYVSGPRGEKIKALLREHGVQ